MPAIRGNAGDKWVRRTSNAGEEYKQGVNNPRTSWAAETAKAAPNYVKGVQASITNKSFEKGVAKAGDQTWQQGAATKGVDRFGPGVTAGKAAYDAGFAPFAQVIASTQLPPRGPKGDPQNIERVRVMAKALRDAKLKQS